MCAVLLFQCWARGDAPPKCKRARIDVHPAPPPLTFAASKGNKLELVGPSAFALVLAAPIVVLHVYYLYLQTYVLRLDLILNAIALAFVAAEVLVGIPAALTFWRVR